MYVNAVASCYYNLYIIMLTSVYMVCRFRPSSTFIVSVAEDQEDPKFNESHELIRANGSEFIPL